MRSSFIKRTMASIVLALVVILAFSPVPLEASLHADGVDYAASTLSSGFPVTIVDDTGYRLVIKKAPARIVSLAPSNTEILFSIGLGDRLVGVTTACDYPQAAAKIDKIGDYTINVEAVVAKRPDLVVAQSDLQMPVVEKLRELGITVLAVAPKTMDEVFRSMEMIGAAAGEGVRARKVVSSLETRVSAVEKAVAGLPESKRPVAFVEIWNDPLMTAGAGTFIDDLITRAGGRNLAGDVDGWPQISPELVVASKPDVIILTCFNKAEVMARPAWQKIPAVVRGAVYELVPDLLVRPGPRLVDGLEALAAIFHPSLFGLRK
ncbi:MAG: cobalamin-binding protein [Bacillota bacterium]|jgi:iron complex transport system substrate-binding protein